MSEPCTALEFTCINKVTKVIVVTPDFTVCDKDLGFVTSKWVCEQNQLATISAQVQGSIDISTASARSFGQSVAVVWVALAVIVICCGFFMGAYIYRK
jgi:hypothetical protein